jgi:hypothetical protein
MGVTARKARGAYYTDPAIARFLVQFAVRRQDDSVLDPCFGEGVFLRAAAERVATLGGAPGAQVSGVELDVQAYRTAKQVLVHNGPLRGERLRLANFFDLDPAAHGHFSAVVGNPPFVRYQRFSGARRLLALSRALKAGVRLTELASSWAPFIVHAVTFLEPEGRLAMVAPAELCHAAYAKPVLHFLIHHFRSVRVLTFGRRLFPELSEDTVLVLGDGYGHESGSLELVPLSGVSELGSVEPEQLNGVSVQLHGSREVIRLIAYLLPERTRSLYVRLAEDPEVTRLGALATSGIGYVTGNNDFFHLSAGEVRRFRVPDSVLTPAVCRASWLTGVVFSHADWKRLYLADNKALLLTLTGRFRKMPEGVRRYLEFGVREGVDRAYKCRVRQPWYAVPHVVVPDLLLTYMANRRPALVVNRARAVAPNTLLCVRPTPHGKCSAETVGAAWWTSLTALSAEIEGHSLGAGMLKLEPGEAANVLVPMPRLLLNNDRARHLVRELDRLVRREAVEEALDLGDREILQNGLQLSQDDCALLRQGFHFLMERRRRR